MTKIKEKVDKVKIAKDKLTSILSTSGMDRAKFYRDYHESLIEETDELVAALEEIKTQITELQAAVFALRDPSNSNVENAVANVDQ